MSEQESIETAIASTRRSRNVAKKQGDRQVAAIMLRAESELLGLLAKREGQLALAEDGETEPGE